MRTGHRQVSKVKHMDKLLKAIESFATGADGGQVVEYALIIAVISITLVMMLNGMTTGNYFNIFIGRLSSCLNTSGCA